MLLYAILMISLIALALSGISLVVLLRRKDDESLLKNIREEFSSARDEGAKRAQEQRAEMATSQTMSTETLSKSLSGIGKLQSEQLGMISRRVGELTESNEKKMEQLRLTMDSRLKNIQDSNDKKLEQMRQTVDEKLHRTLEKRLGESFKLVSDRLEAVQRGLGEMKNLAVGVGDLQKILSNVKTRGIWGEFQLGAILEQLLTPEQYSKNVRIKKNSKESVEFAIRLPGVKNDPDSLVWLPIDSKMPQEDYLRLVDFSEKGDGDGAEGASRALLKNIRGSAKEIHDKYIDPPNTTDFAILFLPTEGLYAEVLRYPNEIEFMQRNYRIVIAGPTTLSAIINSLRVGFQTLAIEKRSSEVWNVLSAVKTEFGRFGEVLSKVQHHLHTASSTLEKTEVRTRAMERKLRDVENLPSEEASKILGLEE